jgi:glyceraldehyde 3-phosphate dehydrogenase
MRVPTPNVSLVDLVAVLEKPTNTEAMNAAFKKAAEGPLKGILQFCEDELVSIDFRGNPHSSIVDAGFSKVIDGDLAKVTTWYDNEWGYSCRVRDLINYVAKSL